MRAGRRSYSIVVKQNPFPRFGTTVSEATNWRAKEEEEKSRAVVIGGAAGAVAVRRLLALRGSSGAQVKQHCLATAAAATATAKVLLSSPLS